MLLETLKDFDWKNEPQRVRFDDDGMHVAAKYRTDFWCCARYDFKKDDGHFFYSNTINDFCCDLDWSFAAPGAFDQCGIMLRTDSENWFKASIMYEDADTPMLATSLTNAGYSDLATLPLPQGVNHVWYRLKKRKGCYIASYSLDGKNYTQIRKFYLLNDADNIQVGAYLCSPQRDDFEAVLHGLTLSA
jgi:regulation of enolase protein 1 (concanavalin A-like superfamily)